MSAPERRVERIDCDKKRFLPLLLLGDEQENIIDRYLERGELFVLFEDGEPATVAVVTREGERLLELKNLATDPAHQRRGCATHLMRFLFDRYKGMGDMLLGTGENDDTLRFYERLGFRYSHTIPNFFIDHYDHLMVENGVVLRDMICLKRPL